MLLHALYKPKISKNKIRIKFEYTAGIFPLRADPYTVTHDKNIIPSICEPNITRGVRNITLR